MSADAAIDALGNLLEMPVATLLIGLAIGYFFDMRREDKKRVEDRRLRRIEAQKQTIGELQLALAEALHGVNNAAIAGFNAKTKLMEVGIYPGAGKPSDVVPDFIETRWHQDWLAAIRRVAILTARVSDSELKALSERCVQLGAEAQPAVEKGFESRFERLERAVHEANMCAGQLYQELITDEPDPWYKRFQRSPLPPQSASATVAPAPAPEQPADTPPPPREP